MTGFTGFVGAAPRGAGFQVFKASQLFTLPFATAYIFDIFGGGGSGGWSGLYANGGGGGARNRQFVCRFSVIPGEACQVIVGAGGVGGSGFGATGGTSSVVCSQSGLTFSAFGGGSGFGGTGGGGGGIAGAGSPGIGGTPTTYSGGTSSPAVNATSDYGGANA
ncbi:MAG: hypothetical protein V4495_21865, partial [Pseudomonadota bacterium]